MTTSQATEWVYSQEENKELDKTDLRAAYLALCGWPKEDQTA